MSDDLIRVVLHRSREGRLSRRQFFSAAGVLVGTAAGTSLLRSLGCAAGSPSVAAAPPADRAEPVPPEKRTVALTFDRSRFEKDPGAGGWLRAWSVTAKPG